MLLGKLFGRNCTTTGTTGTTTGSKSITTRNNNNYNSCKRNIIISTTTTTTLQRLLQPHHFFFNFQQQQLSRRSSNYYHTTTTTTSSSSSSFFTFYNNVPIYNSSSSSSNSTVSLSIIKSYNFSRNASASSTSSSSSGNSKGVAVTSTDLFSQAFKEKQQLLPDLDLLTGASTTGKRRGGGNGIRGKRVREEDEAWAKGHRIKISPYKLNIVAALIRGAPYRQAMSFLDRCEKRVSGTVMKLLESARYNAENNHGLDPTKLYVSECVVGKDRVIKGLRIHAKGRSAIMKHRYSKITIILKEKRGEKKKSTKFSWFFQEKKKKHASVTEILDAAATKAQVQQVQTS